MVEDARPGNLPAETSSWVGRHGEVERVCRMCARSQLVTLTGAGGVGKTRLALKAAGLLAARFRHGVWLVELSPLHEGALLAHAIAESFRVPGRPARPVIESVAAYLAGRELLLVLDTCEHLIDDCRTVTEALLALSPGLRVLATSRSPLGLPIEQVVTVEPLTLPVRTARTAPESDALTLLTVRAAEAVPGFTVTDTNRGDLLRLCARLEGLPLAIELAAARLRELPLAELTERMDDRFAVLDDIAGTRYGTGPTEPPWHRALRTAVGWSHELCTPPERLLWARLSVFAGSFDAAAVRRVCTDERLPRADVPALLAALVDKSVLTWLPTGGGERYRMLDTIREYGVHWLHDLGEEPALRRRHRDGCLDLARRGGAAWLGPDQYRWYDRMHAEHDNLRAALEFSLVEKDGTALDLAGSLWFFWSACGLTREGQAFLERALAADARPGRARSRALWALALVLVCRGDKEGGAVRAAESLAAAERDGDVYEARTALSAYAAAKSSDGDLDAAEAAAGKVLSGYPGTADALGGGLPLAVLLAWCSQCHVHLVRGEVGRAVVLMGRMRAACDRRGERWMRAYADFFLAQAELRRHRPRAARRHARDALEVKHRMHDSLGVGLTVAVLARVASAAGQAERVARLLGLADQVWATVGAPQAGVAELIAACGQCERQARGALGDRAFETAFERGRTGVLDEGVAYALGRV
ncbi:ATP-binding protein [Streptomyces sp. NPDC017941]|uniref:ATP-binding protein n=1 Tax=Streptomyces sp. NPDC017941 TaxID=3365018 RepID=UPI0037B79FBC